MLNNYSNAQEFSGKNSNMPNWFIIDTAHFLVGRYISPAGF